MYPLPFVLAATFGGALVSFLIVRQALLRETARLRADARTKARLVAAREGILLSRIQLAATLSALDAVLAQLSTVRATIADPELAGIADELTRLGKDGRPERTQVVASYDKLVDQIRETSVTAESASIIEESFENAQSTLDKYIAILDRQIAACHAFMEALNTECD